MKSYMKFCVSVLYICSQDSFRKDYVLSCMSQTFLGQSFDTSKAYQLHTICILERLYKFDFFPHCIHILTYWESIYCCSVMMLLHREYALCSRQLDTANKRDHELCPLCNYDCLLESVCGATVFSGWVRQEFACIFFCDGQCQCKKQGGQK